MRSLYVSLPFRASAGRRSVGAADIVACVETELREGRVPPGSRLPPVRVLERQLGLSKNTAKAAYDELVARGLLETRERSGVFVAGRGANGTDRADGADGAVDGPPPLEAPQIVVREPPPLPPAREGHRGVALSSPFVDPALLPRERLGECARAVSRPQRIQAFYDVQGYGPLRELIAARLRKRGIFTDPGSIITTTGSQQALDMVARAVARRVVAIESPVYSHARFLFETHGLEIASVPIDPFAGLDLDGWGRVLAERRPAFLYATTSFQNPTGYSYSSHEIERVLTLARDLGVGLAEDDWGSEMLSGSDYRPSLRALGGSSVVYFGSFTKKLLPSLRVGFVVADPALVPMLVAMKRVATLGNAWLTEAIVAEFLDRGYYDAHLAATQRELDGRYTRCLHALDELMPEGVRWTTPGGGPTLWLEVPREVSLDALALRLAARGVEIEDTSGAFAGPRHLHGFRVSYAFSPPDVVRRALVVVAEELRRHS